MGKSPLGFAALNTLFPLPNQFCDANPERADAIDLDYMCSDEHYWRMSITPKAIQDLLDELEASKQCRLRAWKVLQRLRLVAWLLGSFRNWKHCHPAIGSEDIRRGRRDPGTLEHALTKSFRIRNDAIKSLCSSVRRFRDATIKEECKSDYPHALQALWKALDRAEDLIQN
jgi:hypothetical protein